MNYFKHSAKNLAAQVCTGDCGFIYPLRDIIRRFLCAAGNTEGLAEDGPSTLQAEKSGSNIARQNRAATADEKLFLPVAPVKNFISQKECNMNRD